MSEWMYNKKEMHSKEVSEWLTHDRHGITSYI
jgi:hypothetical protein